MKHSENSTYRQPEWLFALFIIAILIPNILLSITEDIPFLMRICNVVLPAGIYWFLMTLNRNPGKMVWWMFIFVFLAAFQIVLLYLFGRSIIAVDMFLNLVTTNVGEANEVLSNILLSVIAVIVIYIPLLVWACIMIKKKLSLPEAFLNMQRRCACACMVAGLALGIVADATSHKDIRLFEQIYPFNVFQNIGIAIQRNYMASHHAEWSANFSYDASSLRDDNLPEIHVLVIGETARARNFGIYGYDRPTTPRLAATPGIVAFTDVLSQSNTTHKSVPMLLSEATADNFDSIYHYKSIITAFKEAGFHTAFFSNQRPNHSLIDAFGEEADEWDFIKEENTNEETCFDSDLLPLVKKTIESVKNKKIFIVLHTYGSHYDYRERYKKKDARFLPDTPTDASPDNKIPLTNAYDNTILQTDAFLGNLISLLQNRGAVASMLYVSDHGEDIYDDSRRLFLHASPIPTYNQIRVPFIAWTSQEFDKLYPNLKKNLVANKNKALQSSASTFHTMVDLGGLSSSYYNPTLSTASGMLKTYPREYLNDHNRGITINLLIKDPEDLEQITIDHAAFP